MKRTYLNYLYQTADGTYIKEKLARSERHAETMRRRCEDRLGQPVRMTFMRTIHVQSGRVVSGY